MKLTRTTVLGGVAALAVVAAVVVGLALRGPGTTGATGASPLSFFPASPRGVVHLPDLGRVGAALASLEKTRLAELAAVATGSDDPEVPIRAVVGQLGFDPRSPESIAEAGIRAGGGLSFGEDDAGARLLSVAVADEGRFSRYADSLARRLGGARRGEEPVPGAGLSAVVHRTAGDPGRPVLAYAFRDGHAVVAAGAGALEALGRSLGCTPEETLAGSAAFARLRERLGPADALALAADARTFSGARRPRGKNPGPAAAALRLAREGLGLRLVLPRSPAELAAVAPASGTPALDAGPPLLPFLPAETFLAARIGGEPSAIRAVVEALLPRGLSLQLTRAGIDLDRDLLAHLRAGPVLGVGLLPAPDLSGGLPTAGARISTYNPFRLVTVAAFARVRDPAAAREVLERIAAADRRLAMEVVAREEEGEQVYTATYAAGTGMTWGLVGDVLVAAGNGDDFAAARARVKGGGSWELADPAAREAFGRPGAALHLDVPKLAGALSAIPESAFGVGGFQIKASLDGWVEMLSEVGGATASVAAAGDALVVDVSVGLR